MPGEELTSFEALLFSTFFLIFFFFSLTFYYITPFWSQSYQCFAYSKEQNYDTNSIFKLNQKNQARIRDHFKKDFLHFNTVRTLTTLFFIFYIRWYKNP